MGIKLYIGIFLQCLGIGLENLLAETSFRWVPYVVIVIGAFITLLCLTAIEVRVNTLMQSLVIQREINDNTERNMRALAKYLNSSNARLTTIKTHIDQILKIMNDEEAKTIRITDSNKENKDV